MNIEEREEELNQQFEKGLISQKEWVNLYIAAMKDEATYPDACSNYFEEMSNK